MPDRPGEMYMGPRPIVGDFSADEFLFRRINKDDWGDGGINRPWIDKIPFSPAMSVNRERFSKAHQVLYPPCVAVSGNPEEDARSIENARADANAKFASWGVLRIRSRDLLVGPRPAEGKTYDWTIRHMPEICNYSHSELWTGVDGEFSREATVNNKSIRRAYRQVIAQAAEVVYEPGQAIHLYGT